jgi:hypothetical protein
MMTMFFSGDYFFDATRYFNSDNPLLEFKKLEELNDWEYKGETYYFHIHHMNTTNTIWNALGLECVSSYVDNSKSELNKDKYRKRITEEMPTRIKEDVASGKCRYIIDHSFEGYWGIRWDYIQYIFSCKREDIIWLTADFSVIFEPHIFKRNNKDACETHYSNWWERQCAELVDDPGGVNYEIIKDIRLKQLQLIEKRTTRDKMCTYYNRRIRTSRIVMMSIMHHNNLLDETYWSWGGDVDGGMRWDESLRSYHLHPKQIGGGKYEKSYDTIAKWGNIQNGEPSKEDLQVNLVNTLNKDHILNTNFQFINETWATNGDTIFLSEKSFKPFMLMQPFITYGDRYTIQALREYGYNVFDKWIDHSYDSEINALKRAEMVALEIKRLQSLSPSEWTDMLYDMRDGLIHNAKNLEKANSRYYIDI